MKNAFKAAARPLALAAFMAGLTMVAVVKDHSILAASGGALTALLACGAAMEISAGKEIRRIEARDAARNNRGVPVYG